MFTSVFEYGPSGPKVGNLFWANGVLFRYFGFSPTDAVNREYLNRRLPPTFPRLYSVWDRYCGRSSNSDIGYTRIYYVCEVITKISSRAKKGRRRHKAIRRKWPDHCIRPSSG